MILHPSTRECFGLLPAASATSTGPDYSLINTLPSSLGSAGPERIAMERVAAILQKIPFNRDKRRRQGSCIKRPARKVAWILALKPCLNDRSGKSVSFGGERGFTSHMPRCLRTCPPLEDLFDDIFIPYHADYFDISGTFRASQGVPFLAFPGHSPPARYLALSKIAPVTTRALW
jgi:hypothetical protein